LKDNKFTFLILFARQICTNVHSFDYVTCPANHVISYILRFLATKEVERQPSMCGGLLQTTFNTAHQNHFFLETISMNFWIIFEKLFHGDSARFIKPCLATTMLQLYITSFN